MNANMAYGFTEAELDLAKHTDLLGLLSSLGYTLKRVGSYYTTAEMDSIRIRDPTRWKRYSTQQGGDAITFLREFCGMSFPQAVDHLLAYHGRSRDSPDQDKPVPRPKPPPPKEKPPFVLPPVNPDQRRVFTYLQKRGIAPIVVFDQQVCDVLAGGLARRLSGLADLCVEAEGDLSAEVLFLFHAAVLLPVCCNDSIAGKH